MATSTTAPSSTPTPIANTPQQIGKEKRDLLRVAALIGVVATIFLFLFFPNPFTVCMVPLAAYTAYETFTMISNIEDLHKETTPEVRGQWTRQNFVDRICRHTPVLRTLFNATKLDITRYALFD